MSVKGRSHDGDDNPSYRSDLSQTATARLLALHDEEIRAAKMIADPACYSDFYVDKGDGSPAFHEAFGHSISWDQLSEAKKARRMARADRTRLSVAHQRLCAAGWADHFADSQPNGGWDQVFYETGGGGFFESGPSFVETVPPI